MGTHGTVRIEWDIEDDDEGDPFKSPSYTMKKVEVNGMNDVILTAMLEDVRIVHVREGKVSGVEPGLSERAAQALADVHHLPFRWGKGDASKVKAHLRRAQKR